MAVSKQKLDTNDRYLQQLDEIKIRVPKGYKQVIKDFSKELDYKNVNQFIISLINEKMEKMEYNERIPNGVKAIKEKETE